MACRPRSCSLARRGSLGRFFLTLKPGLPFARRPRADIEFMQAMIVHHSQAVEMVNLLLKRGSSKVLQGFGKRISVSQADEIESMKQWLREHKQPIVAAHTHMHHHSPGMDLSKMASGDVPMMPGMLSANRGELRYCSKDSAGCAESEEAR